MVCQTIKPLLSLRSHLKGTIRLSISHWNSRLLSDLFPQSATHGLAESRRMQSERQLLYATSSSLPRLRETKHWASIICVTWHTRDTLNSSDLKMLEVVAPPLTV
jgi:hypothetical protein